MTIWRMSFREGNQGPEMWPGCSRLGIAAITYLPLLKTDLSKHSYGEPKKLWDQLKPAQKASLRRVAYEMKAGDIIYVKQGPKIINKGVVTGSYHYDSKFRLKTPDNYPWAHQVPVKWTPEFPAIKILLGAEQLVVKILTPNDVKKIEATVRKTSKDILRKEAIEGEIFRKEAIFRSRNRALIQAKKANSDYRCEVCGFNFEETYGEIGQDYIIAHHVKLISSGVTKTTIDDIVLLCANCHAMVHIQNRLITIEKLLKLVVNR
jgi:predicted HNH restriction endonuclease